MEYSIFYRKDGSVKRQSITGEPFEVITVLKDFATLQDETKEQTAPRPLTSRGKTFNCIIKDMMQR